MNNNEKHLIFINEKKNIEIKINLKLSRFYHLRNYENLKKINSCLELTINGHIKENNFYVCRGQCLDKLPKYIQYFNNEQKKLLKLIRKIWKEYHLNTMQAGTKKQQNLLIKNHFNAFAVNYEGCCNFLTQKKLLIDRGYKFGSGWLCKKLPIRIINFIKRLDNGTKENQAN